MQADRFTIKSQEALQAAIALAAGRNHTETQPEHLLLALLEQEDADGVLTSLGVDKARAEEDIAAELG
jgi:ATP-dependent Clp protease ATP-binding subunit ClpB